MDDGELTPAPPAAGADARPARILDVAEAAGVSTATVSRALSAPGSVRPATRERILATIRRLNYTPNEAARTLRAGAARMVLVAAPHLYSGAFFAEVVNAVDETLSAQGYTMITGSLDREEEKARRLIDLVYARQIDGIISLANCIGPAEGRSVLDAGVPVVCICAALERPGHPSVVIDDEACAAAQTVHLLERGHRRLFYISGIDGHYNELMRHAGFRRAAAAAGLGEADVRRFPGRYTLQSGVEAADAFLALRPRPTGVVCCSDEMAIGFISRVRSAGLDVPGDVSVVGFDDIDFARFCEPTLTTIHQPRAELGAAGAGLLLNWLAGDPPAAEPRVIRGRLVVRSSTGPAPTGA